MGIWCLKYQKLSKTLIRSRFYGMYWCAPQNCHLNFNSTHCAMPAHLCHLLFLAIDRVYAYLQGRCRVPCGCCYGWFWGWGNWRGCHTLLPGWMSFVVLILEQPAGCYWPWSESNCWPDHFPGRSVKEFDDKVFTIRLYQKYSLSIYSSNFG